VADDGEEKLPTSTDGDEDKQDEQPETVIVEVPGVSSFMAEALTGSWTTAMNSARKS
jgi:hypothetical protein